MELQFEKKDLRYLRRVADGVVYGEQTQELRLPDGMEDIGSVLAAWGQVLLRGKEWHSGGMSVSGGITVWVLYSAEGSGTPQWVEAWLPFQMKWDFPDPGRDGNILAWGRLESLDARCISARKLMLRANVGVWGQALVQDKVSIGVPGEMPEDVQLKKSTYPMCLPLEAGEKSFVLEENLQLPGNAPQMEKIVRYDMQPVILEQKVMGDKLVFRGTGQTHILYMGTDGQLHGWDFQIPFSQYGELENTYEPDGEATLYPGVTSLEMETGEGAMALKAGITCQYVISGREMVEVVEDGYSTARKAQPQWEEIYLPSILQKESYTLNPAVTVSGEVSSVADTACYPGHGQMEWEQESYMLPGWNQILYYDPEGNLRGESCRWETTLPLKAEPGTGLQMYAVPQGTPFMTPIPGGVQMEETVLLQQVADSGQGLQAVTGMEMGEKTPKDPNRPSLILCRMGQGDLWSLAKSCGTTVQEIQAANGLSQEPAPDKILLIPIA